MNFSSDTSGFNFPFNPGEYQQDVHEAEISCKRALQKINSLYGEIMSPRDIQFDDLNLVNNEKLYAEQPHDSRKNQNHYLKTCCTTLQELCTKCENFISQCSSCNQCNCYNLKSKGRERSSNSVRSLHQTSSKNLLNSPVRCTKPEPFSFINKDAEWLKARECKIAKMKEDLNNKIENELNIRIHTKPVPRTTHLPLYNQMIQNKEKRKAGRKEKCLEILNNTKPFDLHYKCKEKAKSSDLTMVKNFNFKAKPVPRHILSNKVSERLKNKEEVRKMLSVERAQHLKEQSSLPFSQRSIPHSRSMFDISSFTKMDNKEYSKKNIAEITKRLYVIKCNETMNSWNEKVLQVDSYEKLPQQNFVHKKVPALEPLPFLYFPVRMSNAALLREKLIRENILAQKSREKKTQLTEEHSKKTVNQEMALKLRSLIPASEREKEIGEKVKNFRVWQSKRQEEYDKELQEIMIRVSEQKLLLERTAKVTKSVPEKCPIRELIDDESDSNFSALEAVDIKDIESKSSASEAVCTKDAESNSYVSDDSDSSQAKSKESTFASEDSGSKTVE